MKPEVIVFIVFLVVYFIATAVLRRYYEMKINALFSTGLYDECFDTLNKFLPRILLTTFRQYSLRFMVHEARGETEMATRMIELMLRMRGSKKRHAQTAVVAFNYFVSLEDKKRAKELLQEIKELCDDAIAQDCQLTYDIMLGKRHDYIEKMEGMLDQADPALKAKLYALIAKQYRNAGKRDEAQKYEALLKQIIAENTPPDPHASSTSGASTQGGEASSADANEPVAKAASTGVEPSGDAFSGIPAQEADDAGAHGSTKASQDQQG